MFPTKNSQSSSNFSKIGKLFRKGDFASLKAIQKNSSPDQIALFFSTNGENLLRWSLLSNTIGHLKHLIENFDKKYIVSSFNLEDFASILKGYEKRFRKVPKEEIEILKEKLLLLKYLEIKMIDDFVDQNISEEFKCQLLEETRTKNG